MASDLHEWADLLTDEVIVGSQAGVDEWGNPVLVTSYPVGGRILTRAKAGGSNTGSETSTHPGDWNITVVFPETSPTPAIGALLIVNGVNYEIDTLTIYDDLEGQSYEASATIIQEGDPT